MQDHHTSSPTVTRIVTVLGVASLIGLAVFGVLFLRSYYAPVRWNQESLRFNSGSICYVFCEPKLVIFLGEDGSEEVFDCISGIGHHTGFYASGSRGSSSSMTGGVEVFGHDGQGDKITMRFLAGKSVMVVSDRGTKLTLADGREFTLDGRTPLWLRCKSDGTIVELEELPAGFVEFFESPPPDPGFIGEVKSWPEAFRK